MARPDRAITLIGGGKMGAALAGGWIGAGHDGPISIHDPNPSPQLEDWAASGKIALNPAPEPASTLVVAVKPQIFPDIAADIRAHVGPDTLVLSIMAGTTLDSLATHLGTQRVARAMPNTPGLIGKGMSVLALHEGASGDDAAYLKDLLAPLGAVEGPLDEGLMGAVTGVSGSGPAYIFLLAEAMAAAGEAEGLPPDLSMRLAMKTIEGAGALMMDSDDPPARLRENVTSPGGTTQAALDVLMREDGMPSLLKEAVAAAARRSHELSGD